MSYKRTSDEQLISWHNSLLRHMAKAGANAYAADQREADLRKRMAATPRIHASESAIQLHLGQDLELSDLRGAWSYHQREVSRFSAAIQAEAAMRAMQPADANPLDHPAFAR